MATHLVAGKKAPDFTGTGQDGNILSLSNFKGGKVILFFIPRMIHQLVLYKLVT